MGFEIINTIKKEKGLTNAQIAQMSGITLSTLDKITSGVNTNPKLDTLQAICTVLGCTLNDFVDVPSVKKESPSAAEAAPGEDRISMEESNRLLVALGLIEDGQDLSDDDLAFLGNVIALLEAWFRKGNRK